MEQEKIIERIRDWKNIHQSKIDKTFSINEVSEIENTYNNSIKEILFYFLSQTKGKAWVNLNCPVCNKPLTYRQMNNAVVQKRSVNCSIKCGNLNPETQNKIKQTCLERYGVENVTQ